MDSVELEFQPEALRAIAQGPIDAKLARGALRSILEELMLDVMYELPSRKDVANCMITPEMVEKRSTAELLWHPAWRKHETA